MATPSKKKSQKPQIKSSRTKKKSVKLFPIIMVGLVLLVFGLALVPKSYFTKEKTAFKKEGSLSFQNASGESIANIDIEIADNDADRQQGLMFREKMKESRGMVFIFDIDEPQSFWMKNTIIPLDILYANSNMEIVKIHKNTVPQSLKAIPSILPARYVVEVNAGYTDKYNIKEGDKINIKRQ